MKDRINKIMRDKTISAGSLAEILSVQASGISHILSGRNNPSLDFIVKFLNSFPDINPEWFILGKGEVYKEAKIEQVPLDLFGGKGLLDSSPGGNSDKSPTEVTAALPNQYNTPVISNKTGKSSDDLIEVVSKKPTDSYNRTIKRVMIFYEDKTVEIYTPD